MMQNKQSFFYAAGSVILWSSVATAFKITLKYIEPFVMLSWATLFSLLSLIIICAITGQFPCIIKQTATQWGRSALMGLLNPLLYYLVLFSAYDRLPAQLAQTLNYTWPAALILLAIPFLKQKPGRRDLLVLIICYSGAILIASRGSPNGFKANSRSGVLLAAGSSLIWAVFWLLNKKDTREESVKLFSSFACASLPAAICLLITRNWQIPGEALAGSLYIGFFEMGFTFFLWSKALQKASHPASLTSILYLAPFLSLLLIRFFLNETLYPTTYPGLFLICLGLIIQNRSTAPPDKKSL